MAGIALVTAHSAARTYLVGGGVIYLLLFAYGLIVDRTSEANVVPLNEADNWLHLGLGVAMVALGLILGGRPAATAADRPVV